MKSEWLTTAPHPWKKAHRCGEDQGQVGWRVHCVVGGSDKSQTALCGLVPRHGWACDLFIDEPCARCFAAAKRLGLDIPREQEAAHKQKQRIRRLLAAADPVK